MSSFCSHIASSFWTLCGFFVLAGMAAVVVIRAAPINSTSFPRRREPGVFRRTPPGPRLRGDDGTKGAAHYAALHSLIESANVPACSRIGAICPVFSAYLNAV